VFLVHEEVKDIPNLLKLRCFGVGKRTWLIELHTTQRDRAIIILSIVIFVVITAWNIAGNYYHSGLLHALQTQGIPTFLFP
jgi:energy-coupling factor transport system permease protein